MTKRICFLLLLFPIVFSSCYKKLYLATNSARAVLQTKYDSLGVENSKNEALNQILKLRNDSLVKNNLAFDKQVKDFKNEYIHFPTGATLSTATVIASAKKYQLKSLTTAAPNVLYNPFRLSYWGNDRYGDCVTAEEAFAKACNNPEIFIPDNVAISWATENGVLNGAQLNDVLSKMTSLGFKSDRTTYNDGNYSYVDFRNSSILQNAISTGPVKLGLTATQLDRAWNPYRRGWFALDFTPEQITNTNGHCATLCGYGTLSWLAQQFNVQLPNGINGQEIGYAIFTWGSIGIINQQSLLAITHEAWIRNPTTVTNTSISSFILKAMGGETNSNIYFSHANNGTGLRGTYPGGFGEMWICHNIGGGKIKLEARGDEAGKYLSHAFGNLDLRSTYDGGSGEEWIVHDMGNGQFALQANGDGGKYLSHAFGNLDLRTNMAGGEAWLNTGQH